MMDTAAQKLDAAGLKKTGIRLRLIDHFLKHKPAVSQPELEKEYSQYADRVTLYRVLNAFEEKGLIHKIIDVHGTARYALCNENNCETGHHHDEHIHFNCTRCQTVVCLEDTHIPPVQLPTNYRAEKYNLNIEGICSDCLSLS